MNHRWTEAGDGCRRRLGGICWLNWVVAFGAVSIMAALILIPVHTSRLEEKMLDEVSDYAEPASLAVASILTSLLRCQQFLIAFQATGQLGYASGYREEHAALLKAVRSAESLSSKLPADSARRFLDLLRSIDALDSEVRRQGLTQAPAAALPNSVSEHAALMRACVETASAIQHALLLEIVQRQQDAGTLREQSVKFLAVGGGLGLIVIFTACSLFEQADRRHHKAMRRLKVRDEVFRVVSHDLSNPLNTIQIATAGWRRIAPPAEQQILRAILRAVKRMDRLIQDLREAAALESGQTLAFNLQEQEVSPLLDEVRQDVELLCTDKALKIECRFPATTLLVAADRNRILQVLGNLVDNAIKFTSGGGRITLGCEAVGPDVRFSVEDNGPGISPEDLPRIFDLYWQAPATAHQGAGLGLATAKRIVEQHGGRIWVESRCGEGTTFYFTISRAGNVACVA
jgi:signal transduction histidine kinase